jgi:IrrE N-terminal-like domain
MATDYAGAVRNGAMAAARLHVEFDTKAKMQDQGGSIDVFDAALGVKLPLLLRPLNGLLGAYLPDPIPGVLVTTERPLSIQRFTAAHELGHFRLRHRPSLDDEENILRRMTMSAVPTPADPDMQEVEADAFAAAPHATLAHRLALPPSGLVGSGSCKAASGLSALVAPGDELRGGELDASEA